MALNLGLHVLHYEQTIAIIIQKNETPNKRFSSLIYINTSPKYFTYLSCT